MNDTPTEMGLFSTIAIRLIPIPIAWLIFFMLWGFQAIPVPIAPVEQTKPLLTQSECLELVNRAIRWEE